MNTTKVLLIAGAVVAILVLLTFASRGAEGFIAGFGTAGAPPVGTFTMYYADWCPHCKSIKPEFSKFAANGVVTVNGRNVAVRMVEESEKDKMAGKEIKGFPTFMLQTADGKTVEFQGDRTPDGYLKFLEEQLQPVRAQSA